MRKVLAQVCALAVCAGFTLQAQSTFGSIVGNVKDASGAFVMHATVKVTGTDENISREVATGSNGNYEALNLKPGFYKVTVDHPGFEQATVENLLLRPARPAA